MRLGEVCGSKSQPSLPAGGRVRPHQACGNLFRQGLARGLQFRFGAGHLSGQRGLGVADEYLGLFTGFPQGGVPLLQVCAPVHLALAIDLLPGRLEASSYSRVFASAAVPCSRARASAPTVNSSRCFRTAIRGRKNIRSRMTKRRNTKITVGTA